MADAVLWQILESVRDGLRTDLTFQAQGTDSVKTIQSDAIVIRKVISKQRESELPEKDERKPGILICPPRSVLRNPQAGTNERDDAVYYVLCQIIDGDGFRDDRHLKTYLKWQEQIAKYFHAQPLLDVQADEGIVNIGHAIETEVVDDTLFVKHEHFVGGVLLEFISRETRGVTS